MGLKLFKLIFLLLITWALGFCLYVYYIHTLKTDPTLTDGIVILTGGKDRIPKGVELLNKTPEAPLLITGVQTKRHLKEATLFPEYEANIDLGFKATTTRENAQEISEWDKIESCTSLKVVTSHYHIPRSLLELKAKIPHIKLIAHPIKSPPFQSWKWVEEPDLWHLLFKEYNKYLIVWVEMRIKSFLK
jgi:uncharacterized SAM-binding protein YcdF (DUF218 family)